MEIKVKYTTMIVDNMEETVNFYRDVLGFEVDSTYRIPLEGEPVLAKITLMRSKGGGAMLELIQSDNYNTGFYSIGMDVNNMDEVLHEMKAKGVKILAEPAPTQVGCCMFIEDPNGVRICLIHHF